MWWFFLFLKYVFTVGPLAWLRGSAVLCGGSAGAGWSGLCGMGPPHRGRSLHPCHPTATSAWAPTPGAVWSGHFNRLIKYHVITCLDCYPLPCEADELWLWVRKKHKKTSLRKSFFSQYWLAAHSFWHFGTVQGSKHLSGLLLSFWHLVRKIILCPLL